MVSRELLKENFDELEITPSDAILDKCVELCIEHDIEEVEFVEHWMAYSVTNLNARIVSPSISQLNDMCKRISKKTSNIPSRKIDPKNEAIVQIYNRPDTNIADEVMDTYCMTPKAKRPIISRITNTPEMSKTIFSPVSYSPISSAQRNTDNEQGNSGKVVYTFGNSSLIKDIVWASNQHQVVHIKLSDINNRNIEKEDKENNNIINYITRDDKYMVDTLNNRALICGDKIYKIGSDISNKVLKHLLQQNAANTEDNNSKETIEQLELTHVDVITSDPVYCLGRIYAGKHALNNTSIKLVDMDELTLRQTRLDCSKIRNYSFFPGQTVILKGTNPRGTQFFVEEVFSECVLETSPAPAHLEKPLNLLIASAPYTDKDDLLYEKLSDLMKTCNENKPDVLIMTGALVDSKSSLLADIAEDFYEYVEKMITKIMDSVGSETHVVIVSSYQDINSNFVYPTHPYEIQSNYNNLHLVPDPCVIDINGVHIGLTSTDVIGHIADQEYSLNVGHDKVKRALNSLFHQKTFYPLNPSPDEVPIDYDLLNQHGKIDILPNIMIVPSDLKCFIRDINNCLCINPGRLSDGSESGTFARLKINPPSNKDTTLFNYAACQIVKT